MANQHTRLAPEELLLSRRRVTDGGCWEWTGSRNGDGYGSIVVNGRHERVHRLAAMLWLGYDRSSGLFVLHRCDNPPCFNPKHLFFGTNRDNILDCEAKGRGPNRRGTHNGRAKLTPTDAVEIRRQYAAKEADTYQLAARYGVHNTTIGRLVRGEAWTLDAAGEPK